MHLAVAVHNVDFVIGEEAVLGGPGQHVLPNLNALKCQAHPAQLVAARGRRRLQPRAEVSQTAASLL